MREREREKERTREGQSLAVAKSHERVDFESRYFESHNFATLCYGHSRGAQ